MKDIKSLLIWDIENISYKFKNDIENILNRNNLNPNKKYVVSKRKFNKNIISLLEKENYKFFYAKTQKTADDKILDILKISLLNIDEIIIISSDSDFVKFVIKNANEKKFHLIIHNNNSKRILMESNLTNKNIKYLTFGENNNVHKHKQKNKKIDLFYHKKVGIPHKKIKDINLNKYNFLEKLNETKKIKKSSLTISKEKKLIKENKNIDFNKICKVKINGKSYELIYEEWEKLQYKRLKEKINYEFSNEKKCSICRQKNKVIYSGIYDIYFCNKCNNEWLQDLEFGKIKYFGENHKERILFFYYKKNFEFLLNKKINYYYNENFDPIKFELKKINIPKCFLKDDREKIENTVIDFYSTEEENSNLFSDFFEKSKSN